jgi:hypothetical protein
VAVIQFSSEEQTAVTFFFDDYNYDKDSLMNRINDITQSDGGQTSTDVALRMAREQVGRSQFIPKNKDPYRRATCVESFEVSVLAHVALRMLAAIFLASQ